jgi:hypothetical protein
LLYLRQVFLFNVFSRRKKGIPIRNRKEMPGLPRQQPYRLRRPLLSRLQRTCSLVRTATTLCRSRRNRLRRRSEQAQQGSSPIESSRGLVEPGVGENDAAAAAVAAEQDSPPHDPSPSNSLSQSGSLAPSEMAGLFHEAVARYLIRMSPNSCVVAVGGCADRLDVLGQ